MEKICIVKRRKKKETFSVTDAGMVQAERLTGISSNILRNSLDTDKKEANCSQELGHEEDQALSFTLTPEQSELIRSNEHIKSLLDETSCSTALDVLQEKDGQYIFNFYLEKTHIVKMLKPVHVCQMLQISKSFLIKLVKKKRIKSYKIGRLRRFSLEDILEFITKNEE